MTDIFGSIKKVMRTQVPKVTKDKTISEVIEILKKESKVCESIDYVYVVEKNDKLIGVFSVKDLFRLSKDRKVESFMLRDVIHVSPSADYKLISRLTLGHGIKALPVVQEGKLIGVVPPKEILYILNNVVRKDIFHFAGIHYSHLDYDTTMDVPILKSITHRTPWLISGLIGILAVAAFIGMFENTLQENIILAFFIPVIVYICGALCTQIETLLVRDIAVMGKDFKIKNYILKQGLISVMIALMISALLFLTITIFWQDNQIASIISLAAFLSLSLTTLTSFFIIIGIKKIGGDPALGGGPFGTVISDSIAIIVYLLVANSML